MDVALAGVETSKVKDDSYVHFGDLVQMMHCDSGAVLSVDVEDRDLRPGEKAVNASATTQLTAPVARNTFILAKYTPPVPSAYEVESHDGIVRYGSKVGTERSCRASLAVVARRTCHIGGAVIRPS